MITGKTNVVGLIGDPVEHSLSPIMHNAAFKKLKLDYVYVPFNVKSDNLTKSIIGAQNLNIKGLNVTIPHKRTIMDLTDFLDQSAQLIGAVNTIKFEDNMIKGYNTDGIGLVKSLEEITSIKNKKIIITGAGGAARAAAFEMVLHNSGEIIIANRTPEKAVKLRDDIIGSIGGDVDALDLGSKFKKELDNADILIDTTPIGMYPHVKEKPVASAEDMHPDLIVMDLVYNPLKTGLLTEAEKIGAKTISGIKMLIYQGIESFHIWTGIKPPVKIFETALKIK
ncbi:MAG: shikimate dehydrogenase [Methanomicrobiales archaeon]